ncbi:GNAT family N-acetyltransferase [Microbacterium sp. SSM24]|uniref:GNAT family N-acetyltransferase n=1 Tax=Microbacterium sp. SSM24 TaxID=2991714 RepID=UPI0022265EB6|nr:GNAT family protein [Microbacterium sp. SSM24]MCW3492816.1 GNAT family N-acetyltransferase [Microbacterium sp. SSM24]
MQVELEPWTDADLVILRRANTAELTEYLGGPETEAALLARHAEYLSGGDAVRMFRIVADGATAGYAGWWEQDHDGAPAYEVGCVVAPEWQGLGVASAALAEVVRGALAAGGGRPLVGYAHAENEASHALCRRAGFTPEGTGVFPGDPPVSVTVWVIRPG